jgi:hypothetical protein
MIIVKYLCEQGADVKLVDKESHSLIHWITGKFIYIKNEGIIVIIVCGHLHLFDILVQYQTPIHTSDIYGAFPIHYASQLCGIDETTIDSVTGIVTFKKMSFYSFN